MAATGRASHVGTRMFHLRLMGLQSTANAINRQIMNIAGPVTQAALMEAAEFIHNDMNTTPPLIPEDTGELQDSWFVLPYTQNPAVATTRVYTNAVICGFSAPHAAYVHEMTQEIYGKPINWTRPGSGPKFLQIALQRNIATFVNIVRTNIILANGWGNATKF